MPGIRRSRAIALVLTLVAVLLSGLQGGDPARAQVGGAFVGVTPTRVLDTRIGTGGILGRVSAGVPVDVTVPGVGGIPADAAGVAINVTVTEPSEAGFVVAWPAGQARPLASNVNFAAGATVANLVMVRPGEGGRIRFFLNAGTAHLVVDATGYFPAGSFQGVTPARLVDTRTTGTPVAPGNDLVVPVLGQGGVPGSGVAAVALNLTATAATGPVHLTLWPTGGPAPLASNVNLAAGDTVANVVLTGVGTGGSVTVRASQPSVHVIVDVTGYFTAASGIGQVAPARLVDTRDGTGAAAGKVGAGKVLRIAVPGRAGVPATGVGGVVANVTLVDADGPLFATVYPAGATRPLASNANTVPGHTVANLVMIALGDGGAIEIYVAAGTHIVVDVLGWTPGTPQGSGTPPATTVPVTTPTTAPPATTAPPTTAAPTTAPPTTAAPVTTAPTTTTAPHAGISTADAAMLAAVNTARATARTCGAYGLFGAAPALTWNAKLGTAAVLHSQDQLAMRTMSHTGSDGSDAGQRITRQAYNWQRYGENVAWNYPDIAAVMAGWLGSDGHCRNIMNPNYREFGSGSAGTFGNPGIYWTQVFATSF